MPENTPASNRTRETDNGDTKLTSQSRVNNDIFIWEIIQQISRNEKLSKFFFQRSHGIGDGRDGEWRDML